MKPRLLFYSDCFIFGGSENVVLNLLHSDAIRERFDATFAFRDHRLYRAGLAARTGESERLVPLRIASNETLFFTLERKRLPRVIVRLLQLPFALCRRAGLYFLWNVARLTLAFRALRPDVLHINNGGYPGAASARHAVIAAKLARVPRVVFMVNNLAWPPRGLADRLLDRIVRRHVTQFVTASRAAAERLARVRDMPRERIISIPNTVPAIRTGRVHAEEGFVLVCVGLLTARKGQRVLLHALANVDRSIRLLLLGDGEDRDALQRLARELRLDDRVTFLGHRDDALDYVAGAHALVLPSVADEDMPYVVLEAMALGRPVIATRVGGVPEEIRDGVDGFVVEPGDADALAAAIEALHRDPERARAMGASAAQRFRDVFAYEAICRRFADLDDGLRTMAK